MATRTRLLIGLVTAALAVLGLAAPAQAAVPVGAAAGSVAVLNSNPGCGTRCDYQNPQTFYVYYCGAGCEDNFRCADDAITIWQYQYAPYWEVRYSPACRTGWTRAPSCRDRYGNLVVGLAFYSLYTQNINNRRAVTYGPASSSDCYTRMLSIAGIWGVGSYQSGPGTTYSPYLYGY
jgi:hypothetical protein